VSQLALDVQHRGEIRFSTHAISLSPGTDRILWLGPVVVAEMINDAPAADAEISD